MFKELYSRTQALLNTAKTEKFKTALIIWIVIFSTIVFVDDRHTRSNTTTNHDLIVKVNKTVHRLDKTSVKVNDAKKLANTVCQNYETLRGAVNDFHGTLDGFLKTAEKARRAAYRRTHNKEDLKAANAYRNFRRHARTVSSTCIKPKPSS